MKNRMKVLLIKPYNKIEEVEIDNIIPDCQKLVDGYIEPVYVSIRSGDYVLLVNEEGKIMNLAPNIFNLVGNIVIVKQSNEDFIGLNDKDITMLKNELK